MTDQKIIRITQRATDADVTLNIACSEENAWVHVHWQDFLGGQKIDNVYGSNDEQFELKEVTYRIGEGKPVSEEMLVLDDRTTTQIGNAEAFITKVRTANRLVLQTQPYNENPKTVVFDTTGLTEILNAKRRPDPTSAADLCCPPFGRSTGCFGIHYPVSADVLTLV